MSMKEKAKFCSSYMENRPGGICFAKRALSGKPALAIWGEQDRTFQGKYFLPVFRSAFPNGIIQEIDRAGHYSPEDQPGLVGELIDHFMRASAGKF
jgi:haloalkane dehalogenase